MAKLLMKVDGQDGQIELTEDRIIIYRRGLFNMFKYGYNSQREIPIGAVSEVAFRNASALTIGSIEFVRSGRSVEEKKNAQMNTVKFTRAKQQEFTALKEKIFELINQASKRAP